MAAAFSHQSLVAQKTKTDCPAETHSHTSGVTPSGSRDLALNTRYLSLHELAMITVQHLPLGSYAEAQRHGALIADVEMSSQPVRKRSHVWQRGRQAHDLEAAA
eukprot:CAMPEP_0197701678 /NCGR_PEP_ID=MMETSP1338-20131121/123555_1 /TAXON_ID=43686 ORGANISM="Pelagodinium beii, Strain RCC1491" /NCGR_SAMPLE_ID=MMETSP1338 /ASSEMBLY_ACC=CAM_ASM_000754 /LENGTH=103 /DNA_ID=CAMNT_0043285401 /DNA_START=48 /DNA_END=354 /DNA_ORIENTATION=+